MNSTTEQLMELTCSERRSQGLTEPNSFYFNRETKKFQWEKPTGGFQNTCCEIQNTFAEMFPMWAGRILVTGDTEKWILTAANTATGLATSVIMSPAEAGIEGL